MWTLADLHAFGEALLADGVRQGERLLSRTTVAEMTTNQLTPEQVATTSPDRDGTIRWGFGVGIELRRTGPAQPPGTYGSDGGLGSSWANDPSEDVTGVLLTNQMWTSPQPPAVFRDFWSSVYAVLAD